MRLIKRITYGEAFDDDASQQKSVRVVLLDGENLVALLYLAALNFFTIPGGGVEGGEELEQAVIREMREETGCAVEITHELGIIVENSKTLGWNGINHCYIAKVKGDKGLPCLTEEEAGDETQLRWHGLEEALGIIANQKAKPRSEKEAGLVGIIQQRDIALLKGVRDGHFTKIRNFNRCGEI